MLLTCVDFKSAMKGWDGRRFHSGKGWSLCAVFSDWAWLRLWAGFPVVERRSVDQMSCAGWAVWTRSEVEWGGSMPRALRK